MKKFKYDMPLVQALVKAVRAQNPQLSKHEAIEFVSCMVRNKALADALKGNVCVFQYMTSDGSTRTAIGTALQNTSYEFQGGRESSPLVQVYFDFERQKVRSFRKDRLLRLIGHEPLTVNHYAMRAINA